jgi:hypothetical protein
MVTIGSIAVTRPELFMSWLKKYGADRLILGAAVRNGKIIINGWKEDSEEDLMPFLRKYVAKGVRNVLCTEISKDSTLEGPAIELYKVLSGTAEWTLEGVTSKRVPGEVILHPSNKIHKMQTYDQTLLALYTWSGNDVVTLSEYV